MVYDVIPSHITEIINSLDSLQNSLQNILYKIINQFDRQPHLYVSEHFLVEYQSSLKRDMIGHFQSFIKSYNSGDFGEAGEFCKVRPSRKLNYLTTSKNNIVYNNNF